MKHLLYTAIILLPFFSTIKSKAQNRERHRSVTINQTVVDDKIVASDTIITYTDTTTRTINSKEVSMEMPYTKGSTVYIKDEYRKLNIKQSKDGKVRLVTTTFFYGEPAFTNEQWLEKLNIAMKNTDTGMVITSGGITRSATSSTWSSSPTDWSKVIAERNEAALERAKATMERSKASIERNRELAQRNKELAEKSKELALQSKKLAEQNKELAEKSKGLAQQSKELALQSKELATGNKPAMEGNSTIPQPPVPPLPPATTYGAFGEASANDSGAITMNGTAIANGWGTVSEFGPARSFSFSTGSNTAVFDEKGNYVYSSNSLRRELTIYLPAEAKLNVVSKYADVTADHDLKNLHIKVSNGSLDMVNADNATIISTYSNISCGNISTGNITATNSKLSVKNAGQLSLNTKYTKAEADNVGTLNLKSVSDDYDLDVVKSLNGTKTYGKLRIDKLTGSFDLKGSSADVRVRNIEPTVSSITLDNKYADLQFPVSNLKNYEVVFAGNYSSVFAPFERRDTVIERPATGTDAFSYTTTNGTVVSKTKPGTAPAAQNGTVQKSDDNRTIYTTTDGAVMSIFKPATASRSRTSNFVASVGDTKGTHTKFNLTCTSCNVDFK